MADISICNGDNWHLVLPNLSKATAYFLFGGINLNKIYE